MRFFGGYNSLLSLDDSSTIVQLLSLGLSATLSSFDDFVDDTLLVLLSVCTLS